MLTKVLSSLLLLSTFIFIVLVTALPVNNPDIWYHLKTGEYIFREKMIPKKDFFSFTAKGREWVAQWWLYDVVVYFLQSRFGFNSLIYLKVAIGLLIFLILYPLLKNYHLPNDFICPLFLLSAWIIGTAWVDRPHVFSYLFIVFLIWILISYQFGQKKPLWFIPPLFLVWSNTHASIPIALVLMGFLIVSEVWERISLPNPRKSRRIIPFGLILILTLGTVASLINPNTYKTHLYVFKINPEFVSQNIVEWLPLSSYFEDPHIRLFLVFSFLALVSFFFNLLRPPKRLFRISLFEILLTASLAYLSLSALRFTPVSVLIVLPFMAKNLWSLLQTLNQKTFQARFSQLPLVNPSPAAIKIALILVIFGLGIAQEKRLNGTHLGVEGSALPISAIEFIDQVQPSPPMFHAFNWGGYLIWRLYPKYEVFIDGRLDMYVPDIYNEWLEVVLAKQGWKEILAKYKINFCFVSNEDGWARLNQALEDDLDWIPIYWDGMAAIFLKNDPRNQEILDEYGMTAISLYHPSVSFKPGKAKEAEEEYLKFLKRYPQSAIAYNKLGILYFATNEEEKAKENLKKAIELDPQYATAHFNLGLVLESQGDYDQALGCYQKTKALWPELADVYKRLGYIYSQKLNYPQEASWHLKKYLELGPQAPDKKEVEAEIDKNRDLLNKR